MGDRYDINVECAYCNHLNEDVWYAPTCSSDTFVCRKCKKLNFITQNFESKKIVDVSFDEIKAGFLNATMGTLTDEEIEKICQEHYTLNIANLIPRKIKE